VDLEETIWSFIFLLMFAEKPPEVLAVCFLDNRTLKCRTWFLTWVIAGVINGNMGISNKWLEKNEKEL